MALFNEASEMLNDVAKFEYYADPASGRIQVARLIVQLKSAIEQLNADKAAYSMRNVLAVSKDNAVELLRRRLSEGAAFLDSYVEHNPQDVRRWSSEASSTLRRLFKTAWHAEKFDEEMDKCFSGGPVGSIASNGLSYRRRKSRKKVMLFSSRTAVLLYGGS